MEGLGVWGTSQSLNTLDSWKWSLGCRLGRGVGELVPKLLSGVGGIDAPHESHASNLLRSSRPVFTILAALCNHLESFKNYLYPGPPQSNQINFGGCCVAVEAFKSTSLWGWLGPTSEILVQLIRGTFWEISIICHFWSHVGDSNAQVG